MPVANIIADLTGTAPAGALAGTTHPLKLKTQYYSATVPVWLDLVAAPNDWAASFLSPEAEEVLAVLGGVVVVFKLPSPNSKEAAEEARKLLSEVGRVMKNGLGGWEWDGVGLAVGVGAAADDEEEEWDEVCAEGGLEFVRVGEGLQERNAFGEKTGIARVKEALEANDWTSTTLSLDDNDEDEEHAGEEDLDDLDFGRDEAADAEGLRRPIFKSEGEGEEDQAAEVAQMEALMDRLRVVREEGKDLSPEQRRRLAKRAVKDVMRSL